MGPFGLLVILSPLYRGHRGRHPPQISGSPVFSQRRVGFNGRPFEVIKFRTMVFDAEARLTDLLPLNEINGHAFKLPTIRESPGLVHCCVGRSLDELPQVWNVLRSDMSLVGPRPPSPRGRGVRRLASPSAVDEAWDHRAVAGHSGRSRISTSAPNATLTISIIGRCGSI